MLMWWRSAVNFSFFLCLAACRMRSSACDTVARFCARPVLCWLAFPSAPALGSTDSAADRSALFAGFTATMAESDFPRPCIIGYGSSPSRCGPRGTTAVHRPDVRSPRFRRLPFVRDVFFDHGRVSSACASAALLMLRSTIETVSAPAICPFVAQSHTPRNRCVRFVAAVVSDHAAPRYRAPATACRTRSLRNLSPAFLARQQSILSLKVRWIASRKELPSGARYALPVVSYARHRRAI